MRGIIGLALFGAFGCRADSAGDAAADEGWCDDVGETRIGVIDDLWFARVDADGVSAGFDLDGAASSGGGSDGCGVLDYTDPQGAFGVDNVFGSLMPTLELTEFVAVETLIHDAINTGELLLFTELMDVDDPADDPCVDIQVGQGIGDPLVGTDDYLLRGQTFDRDPNSPGSWIEDAELAGGAATGGPFDMGLPLQIFEKALLFNLQDGAFRAELLEDGSMRGYFGGGVSVDEILAVASFDGVDDGLYDLMESLLGVAADLAPDENGECTQISVTFEFTAVSAYFFDD